MSSLIQTKKADAVALFAALGVLWMSTALQAGGLSTIDLSRWFSSGGWQGRWYVTAVRIVDLLLTWWGLGAALALAGAASALVFTARYFLKKYGWRYAVNWLAAA